MSCAASNLMLDLFQEGCCGLELYSHENYKSLSNLWVGEGVEPQKKEQVSVPIRRPTGETTEILLEKHKAADVGRIYGPSSVSSECY